MKKQLLSIFAAIAVSTVVAQTPSPSWTISQNAAFTNTSVGIRFLDAVDPNVVWVMGYDGFAPRRNYNWFSRTTNGGTSWTPGTVFQNSNTAIGDTNNYVPANLEGIDANTAWVCAYQKSSPYSATNPGGGVIYRTTNGGTSWSNMTATGMFTNTANSFADFVTFLTPSVGIAVGDPVGGAFEIWRTTNGGLSWSPISSTAIPAPFTGEYGIVNLYAKQGTSNIWFGTNQGRIFYTNNTGLTWSVSAVAVSSTTITEIAFNTPQNGVCYAVNSGATFEMYNTTNGGATWSQITTIPANVGLNDICGVPGTNQFVSVGAGSTNTIISYSNNNGAAFTDYGSIGIQYLCVDFATNAAGWAGSFSDNTNPSIGGIWKYNGSAITGTSAPASAFAITPNVCLTGPSATLIPTNSSTGNPAVTYSWSASPAGASFSSPTASAPLITFSSGNTYTITLTVTSSLGSNSSTQYVTVQACSLPTVGFSVAATGTVCNNSKIGTTNTSTGGAPAPSYSWSAIPSTGVTFSPSPVVANPSVIIATPGTYSIQLAATNSQGSVSTINTVTVASCAPQVSFSVPAIFFKCDVNSRLQTLNQTPVTNGPNSYTWSIQPSSGVSIAPPGVNAQNISANITNTAITNYTITLKSANASGTAIAVQTFSVVFDCVGLNENSLEGKVGVFPNPAHDQLNIVLSSNVESYNVKLVNVLGAVVLDEKVNTNGKESVAINLVGKPKGVYFLTVMVNNEKATRKIVIE